MFIIIMYSPTITVFRSLHVNVRLDVYAKLVTQYMQCFIHNYIRVYCWYTSTTPALSLKTSSTASQSLNLLPTYFCINYICGMHGKTNYHQIFMLDINKCIVIKSKFDKIKQRK